MEESKDMCSGCGCCCGREEVPRQASVTCLSEGEIPMTKVGLMTTNSKPSCFEISHAAFSANVCSQMSIRIVCLLRVRGANSKGTDNNILAMQI